MRYGAKLTLPTVGKDDKWGSVYYSAIVLLIKFLLFILLLHRT